MTSLPHSPAPSIGLSVACLWLISPHWPRLDQCLCKVSGRRRWRSMAVASIRAAEGNRLVHWTAAAAANGVYYCSMGNVRVHSGCLLIRNQFRMHILSPSHLPPVTSLDDAPSSRPVIPSGPVAYCRSRVKRRRGRRGRRLCVQWPKYNKYL